MVSRGRVTMSLGRRRRPVLQLGKTSCSQYSSQLSEQPVRWHGDQSVVVVNPLISLVGQYSDSSEDDTSVVEDGAERLQPDKADCNSATDPHSEDTDRCNSDLLSGRKLSEFVTLPAVDSLDSDCQSSDITAPTTPPVSSPVSEMSIPVLDSSHFLDSEVASFLAEIESISIKPVVEDAISDGKKLCADIAVGADIGFIPRADASMSNSSPRVESSMSNLCPQAKTSMSNSSPDAHSVDDKAQNISVPINPYCSMFVKGASEFTHHSEKDDGEVNGVTTTGTTEQETPPEPKCDWQTVKDDVTQCYYYWNMVTNAVTWEIPPDYTQYLLLLKEYEERLVTAPPVTLAAALPRNEEGSAEGLGRGSNSTCVSLRRKSFRHKEKRRITDSSECANVDQHLPTTSSNEKHRITDSSECANIDQQLPTTSSKEKHRITDSSECANIDQQLLTTSSKEKQRNTDSSECANVDQHLPTTSSKEKHRITDSSECANVDQHLPTSSSKEKCRIADSSECANVDQHLPTSSSKEKRRIADSSECANVDQHLPTTSSKEKHRITDSSECANIDQHLPTSSSKEKQRITDSSECANVDQHLPTSSSKEKDRIADSSECANVDQHLPTTSSKEKRRIADSSECANIDQHLPTMSSMEKHRITDSSDCANVDQQLPTTSSKEKHRIADSIDCANVDKQLPTMSSNQSVEDEVPPADINDDDTDCKSMIESTCLISSDRENIGSNIKSSGCCQEVLNPESEASTDLLVQDPFVPPGNTVGSDKVTDDTEIVDVVQKLGDAVELHSDLVNTIGCKQGKSAPVGVADLSTDGSSKQEAIFSDGTVFGQPAEVSEGISYDQHVSVSVSDNVCGDVSEVARTLDACEIKALSKECVSSIQSVGFSELGQMLPDVETIFEEALSEVAQNTRRTPDEVEALAFLVNSPADVLGKSSNTVGLRSHAASYMLQPTVSSVSESPTIPSRTESFLQPVLPCGTPSTGDPPSNLLRNVVVGAKDSECALEEQAENDDQDVDYDNIDDLDRALEEALVKKKCELESLIQLEKSSGFVSALPTSSSVPTTINTTEPSLMSCMSVDKKSLVLPVASKDERFHDDGHSLENSCLSPISERASRSDKVSHYGRSKRSSGWSSSLEADACLTTGVKRARLVAYEPVETDEERIETAEDITGHENKAVAMATTDCGVLMDDMGGMCEYPDSMPADISESVTEIHKMAFMAFSKLAFLDVTSSGLSPLQHSLVQLETRYTDWLAGGLLTLYMYQCLREVDSLLLQYESSSVPAGWIIQWDSHYRRYFYVNLLNGESQWEYPDSQSGEEGHCDQPTHQPWRSMTERDLQASTITNSDSDPAYCANYATDAYSALESMVVESDGTDYQMVDCVMAHQIGPHYCQLDQQVTLDVGEVTSVALSKEEITEREFNSDLVSECVDAPRPQMSLGNTAPDAYHTSCGDTDSGTVISPTSLFPDKFSSFNSDMFLCLLPPPPPPSTSVASPDVKEEPSMDEIVHEDVCDYREDCENVDLRMTGEDQSGITVALSTPQFDADIDGEEMTDEAYGELTRTELEGGHAEERQEGDTAVISKPPQLRIPQCNLLSGVPAPVGTQQTLDAEALCVCTAPSDMVSESYGMDGDMTLAAVCSSNTGSTTCSALVKSSELIADKPVPDEDGADPTFPPSSVSSASAVPSDVDVKREKHKKRKKEKQLSSQSMALKRKGVGSLVQKWQKVKWEVEREEMANEKRQLAIRQQLNEWKRD